MECKIPPPGWYCTRNAPHDGPCAALPESERPVVHKVTAVDRFMVLAFRMFFAAWVIHFIAPQLSRVDTFAAIVLLICLVSVGVSDA